MTYALTVNEGFRDVVTPDGERHQGGDVIDVPDDQYGEISPTALALLFSKSYLGGCVSHQVTLNAGLRDVVLPNGLRYQGSAVVTLSDAQYSTIDPAAKTALFSADSTSLT